MNLGGICRMAARYTDRYDEYVKTAGPDGSEAFEGEALHWFQVFSDAVNEAYFEISRTRLTPGTELKLTVPVDRVIRLEGLKPEVCTVCGVYFEDGATEAGFVFRSRTELEVTGAQAGDTVVLRYHSLPERLEAESDEPVFPESQVDPTVYACLAAARLWQSERKNAAAQLWLAEYYRKLRELRPSMKPASGRRLKLRAFR